MASLVGTGRSAKIGRPGGRDPKWNQDSNYSETLPYFLSLLTLPKNQDEAAALSGIGLAGKVSISIKRFKISKMSHNGPASKRAKRFLLGTDKIIFAI